MLHFLILLIIYIFGEGFLFCFKQVLPLVFQLINFIVSDVCSVFTTLLKFLLNVRLWGTFSHIVPLKYLDSP